MNHICWSENTKAASFCNLSRHERRSNAEHGRIADEGTLRPRETVEKL